EIGEMLFLTELILTEIFWRFIVNFYFSLQFQFVFSSKLIIQVHDELVLDVVKEELDIIENEVKKIMENVIHLNVPLKVDIGHGKNWLEAH
ncbi:MAG TPA: DNA polymerase, partial [Bacteroidales bacterium]|nr:DNA polymerase [Bacteroidales bacterium]